MGTNSSVNKASFTIERDEVFKYWLEFTAPIHNLSKSEMLAMAEILSMRHKLKEKINDVSMIEKYIFSRDGRVELCERLKVDNIRLNNLIFSLRKKGAIVDDGINKAYIANIKEDTEKYYINLEFKLV